MLANASKNASEVIFVHHTGVHLPYVALNTCISLIFYINSAHERTPDREHAVITNCRSVFMS